MKSKRISLALHCYVLRSGFEKLPKDQQKDFRHFLVARGIYVKTGPGYKHSPGSLGDIVLRYYLD